MKRAGVRSKKLVVSKKEKTPEEKQRILLRRRKKVINSLGNEILLRDDIIKVLNKRIKGYDELIRSLSRLTFDDAFEAFEHLLDSYRRVDPKLQQQMFDRIISLFKNIPVKKIQVQSLQTPSFELGDSILHRTTGKEVTLTFSLPIKKS